MLYASALLIVPFAESLTDLMNLERGLRAWIQQPPTVRSSRSLSGRIDTHYLYWQFIRMNNVIAIDQLGAELS